MKLVATPALLARLQAHRLFTAPDRGDRWKLGDALLAHPNAELEPYSHIFGGRTIPRRFGAFSYSHSSCDPYMSIGRYCSISWSVSVMGNAHPDAWLSSSPFSYDPSTCRGFGAYLQDVGVADAALQPFDAGPRAVVIGNDVWIGADVMIKRGVQIGDGAVIGARSLVTKDVPPYAVVAGSPARILRYRFPEALIARLLAIQWWRFGPDVLQPLDVRAPEPFVDQLEEKISFGDVLPPDFAPLTGPEMLALARRTAPALSP